MNATFEQLKKIVLPTLEMYKDDLLKHDRNILESYDGIFLYAHRKTGTDLLRLLPTFENYKERFKNNYADDTQVKKWLKEEIIWITSRCRNTNFLYFNGKKLVNITSDQANNIFNIKTS
jgi:hypothetical protein